MKYTKYVITAFAVFASLLMLMIPTMARPIQEKVTMDSIRLLEKDIISPVEDIIASPIELAEQEPIGSFEELIADIENNLELTSLTDQIEDDEELNRIVCAIEETDDIDTKVTLTNEYIAALQDNEAFTSLIELFESEYSSEEMELIFAEMGGYNELEAYYESTIDTQEDYVIGGAIPLPDMGDSEIPITDASSFSGNIDLSSSTSISSGDSTFTIDNTISSGTVYPITGDDGISDGVLPDGFSEPEDASFYLIHGGSDGVLPDGFSEPEDAFFYLTNINGDVYIPGYGWIGGELWDLLITILAYLVDIATIITAGIIALTLAATWLILGTSIIGGSLWFLYSFQDLFDGENHQLTPLGELVWCFLNSDNLFGGFADGFNYSWDALMYVVYWALDLVSGDDGD